MRGRLALDLGLVVLMLVAFAYPLTGNRLHEVFGTAFIALAGVHNLLARRWYAALGKGRMRPRRILATGITLPLLAAVLLLTASGLMNSHDLVPVLRTDADLLDRRVHAWAASWVLVLASLHLGSHWPMVAGEARRFLGIGAVGRAGRTAWRAAAALLVGFGVVAVFERHLPFKLAGLYSFDDWGADRSAFGFFARYVAILSVGVGLAHLGHRLFRPRSPDLERGSR